MTTAWVLAQPYDEPHEYFDTEREATSRAQQLTNASGTPAAHVIYPIDVEPAVRGSEYWNRPRKAAA